MKTMLNALALIAISGLAIACGDEGTTEADMVGVAAECENTSDCPDDLTCLTEFKGGYCGVKDCTANADCPEGASCVAHELDSGDTINVCFRDCENKAECNDNRTEDNEANCSSNIEFVEEDTDVKSCVPPSA